MAKQETKPEKVEDAEKTAPKYQGLNIHQRLHAVMKEVDYVQKTKAKAGGLQYNAVSHDKVTATIRVPCVDWGVIYYPVELVSTQDGNRTQVNLKLRFVNIDEPKDFIETPSLGYGIDSQDKGPGKAISYAVKYALLKSFGLETGDDPENDSIDHKPDPIKAAVGMAYDAEQNKQAYDYALKYVNSQDNAKAIDDFLEKNKNKLKNLPKEMNEDLYQAASQQKTDIASKQDGAQQ